MTIADALATTDSLVGRETLVRLRGITCAYDAEPVIEDVDLVVGTGDFIGVVGPSGSGKSTLLRAISGAIDPVRGTVERTGVRFGFVPQLETVNWDFPVTVAECVLMARTRPVRRFWASRAERAAEREQLHGVLDRLGIGKFADRHIRALSGGQQQRMFLARALMTDADVLLLDEPTSGLDVKTRHEVLHLLDDLRGQGMAVVITTHDLNGIAAHLPSVVCLNRVVVGAGTPAEVLTPENLEATYGSPMEVLQHAGMPVVVDASPDLRAVMGS
ncbi:MAG: metal ABC transporter ATP-binding protein [Actinomycetota bacterium]